ncbi:phosphoribosylaminoimidazolesuccinocarboxamide synthase [Halorientalis sp. IM1011]|uniref:phosphoribosylaminoimidazolesuccinocarboxamide synthase n=1 Tax=Halorientalis sp. IM1011 TaxID=1932360 RepID=UPI00097CD486|nr:phosphoribosylaminoimidazolesuccinocarboxamide synthase [Halorientalis sp. IM1011]AQL43372.1 phosphoribosylaminoimidazolesuccinocarboxamide synthase [Halorientalis sp. IM1011]
MTSVKDFRVERAATATELGRGAFVFTDDYSVFDWGKMPDAIPNKGASLCAMGAYNFELLEDAGIPTHYDGVVGGSGEAVPLSEVADPPREMAIELTQVPDLPHDGREYDYDAYYADAGENHLIPLEIVFRNTVPVGSSLRSRADPADFDLDFAEWPDEVVDLPEPVVEFSTKLEESDRYLDRSEADRIAGPVDIDRLEDLALSVNEIVTDRADEVGLVHEDGKIECFHYDGEIRVADVVGTFDENRFSFDGQEVSKEVIRQYHKRTQPEWVEAVSDAKERAKAEDVADWKALCERDPEPLPDHVVDAARDLYTAGTNAYVGRDLFDAPSLSEAVETVQDL